ncbi:MAG TPA: NUDIX domain-containing protein [Anaeromyxobacter sp.]|nr:NUDIX domain-containing protein [Anaeromyxobacter sp.]
MIVRVDVVPLLLEARRVLVAEVIGGYHGQAQLGRWWLPSAPLGEGEQPGNAAARIVREQLGLGLEAAVVVGTRQARVGPDWHLALAVAGEVSGDSPQPGPPVSGYAARTLAELPDQLGFWHRDDVAILVARYERLRA